MSDAVDAAADERAVYIHIPFCHRRCPYCDFAVVDMSSESRSIDRYLAAITAEVAMADPWGPVHAVNIGGGTPSVLAPDQIEQLLNSIRERFGCAEGAEISLEANPEDVTASYAQQLGAAGVNRISLGVQSFDPAVLAYLGRNHSPAQAAAAVHNVAAAGLNTTNVDLIFGAPLESLESWEDTVRTALSLGVDHLSAYALTVERGTDLSRAVGAGAAAPDADDQADKFEALIELIGTTLDHYEVSNWSRPGHRCRYNMTTWAQGEYLAFGLGAHGHRAGVRSRNYRRLDAYLQHVESGRRPLQSAEQLDEWDREKERVFLGLRRRAGVAVGAAGTALVASPVGQRFLDAGIITVVRERLIVAKPLLTDAVLREVLALDPPT